MEGGTLWLRHSGRVPRNVGKEGLQGAPATQLVALSGAEWCLFRLSEAASRLKGQQCVPDPVRPIPLHILPAWRRRGKGSLTRLCILFSGQAPSLNNLFIHNIHFLWLSTFSVSEDMLEPGDCQTFLWCEEPTSVRRLHKLLCYILHSANCVQKLQQRGAAGPQEQHAHQSETSS